MRFNRSFSYSWGVFIILFISCSSNYKLTIDDPSELIEISTSNKVVFWGHSAGVIIEPFVKQYLEKALDIDIEFEACSVNSETMLQVAARQGSFPPYFSGSVCTPTEDGYCIANEEFPFHSTYDNRAIQFSIINGFNPCSVNGVTGTLSRNGNNYFFKPDKGQDIVFAPFNIVYSFAHTEFRNALVTLFWCDQTADNQDLSEFLKKYELMTQFVGNENYFMIGAIVGTDESRSLHESSLSEVFGGHYFNGRKYLLSEAKKEIDKSTSASDIERINAGQLPSFYMADAKHLNQKAARLISNKIVDVVLGTPSVQAALYHLQTELNNQESIL